MKPIEAPDNHHLSAAEGWLELGNPLEVDPNRPEAWIHHSFALHELKRT